MAIPSGYRLLTAEDVGKVFGVDLETTAYVYFADDYANFEVLGTSKIQLTDFITYEYTGDMGGAYISFDSSVSGADNLWLNAPTSFETCTIAEGTELTTFNTDADWNNWFYVKDIVNPYNITSSKPKITINCKGKLMTKDLTISRELWDGSYEDINDGGSN